MNRKLGLPGKIWEIVYPVGMYYASMTIGFFVAQLIFGAENETYMLRQIIASLIAIPVVYADFKRDMVMTGKHGRKESLDRDAVLRISAVIGITICVSISLNNIISMSPLVKMSAGYENANNAFYGSSIWLELIGSALITPFLEELLHRGVVYGRLRRMMGMWPSVIVSALIFAALHFNIVQFIYAFLLGLVFALFVEKTDRLYPAVIAHVVANTIAVIRTETGFLLGTVNGSVSAWIISIVLLVIGGIGLFLFYQKK